MKKSLLSWTLAALILVSPILAATVHFSRTQVSIGTNLAMIPNFWSASNLSTEWVINSYDSATSQSIVYPYMEDDQTTIELNPNPTLMATSTAIACGGIYELDGQKTPVNAGDQVIYNVWLVNEAPSAYEGSYGGTRVGIDMWASVSGGRICEITTPNGETTYPNYPASMAQCFIPFGTSTLTEISISFTVKPQYEADAWGDYAAGTMIAPAYIVPWILGVSSNPASETARTWIFATELAVNGPGTTTTQSSNQTPTPTPTPTTYTAIFHETSLPSGTSWNVICDGKVPFEHI